jgi:hypothetical protein
MIYTITKTLSIIQMIISPLIFPHSKMFPFQNSFLPLKAEASLENKDKRLKKTAIPILIKPSQ